LAPFLYYILKEGYKMNRNQGRPGLGIDEEFQVEDAPAPMAAVMGQQEAPAAPTLNWTTPTEMVELPSKGLFYPEGHPLHNQGTVEIRYMTAKEEDILTSKALLKQGVAIDRMLQNLLADKTINVNSLLVGDKNALIVAARITGYGPEYETKVTCPSCSETTEYTFSLEDEKTVNVNEGMQKNNVTFSETGNLLVELPTSKVMIEFRMLTGADEIKLAKEAERKAKKKLDQSMLTDQFKSYIVSVNGDNSAFSIASFVQAMPARDSRHLRQCYASCVPNIDLRQVFDCSECGYNSDMEVPLTADFFWPR
jgi:hypothetical protein